MGWDKEPETLTKMTVQLMGIIKPNEIDFYAMQPRVHQNRRYSSSSSDGQVQRKTETERERGKANIPCQPVISAFDG
jgi:hypothetical protein